MINASRLVILSLLSLISSLIRADALASFGVDDYLALEDVSEIAVSPDGEFVAYTLTSKDLEKDEEKSAVWMMPAAGGDALRMTSDNSNASGPKWVRRWWRIDDWARSNCFDC